MAHSSNTERLIAADQAPTSALPARKTIQFYHRGRVVEISDVEPTRTVLEWLRETACCTGTKEGCAEGDCGACTVIVAELPGVSSNSRTGTASPNLVGGLLLRPINACIKFLPTLDGCALFTVEDLKDFDRTRWTETSGWLHPVQQAMVDCHASQCGFCTPGFVMSLTATYERHAEAGTRPTRAQLSDDIAGNLCRCTGYRPILDAGEAMFKLPQARLNTEPVVEALKKINKNPLTTYVASGTQYWAPRTLKEFAKVRAAHPTARLLSGSTDIGLWVNKQMRDIGDLIYIGGVDELKTIEETEKALLIGAGVTLEDAWSAIVARWPHLLDIWLRFASPPVRHAGTLGGNIANGSPIGDSPPALMALGARAVLHQNGITRELALEEFYVDYMKNAMQPGEFLQALRIPKPSGIQLARAYKVSKRFDSDISAVCAAFLLEFGTDRSIKSARFAFGGMAATVKRAERAEAALVGKRWSEDALRLAQEAIGSDFTPLSDLRASADYRKSVVRGLLERFWLETRYGTDEQPLKPEEASVFAAIRH
jgi:xanthine dehydrogenase small subunit